MAEPRTLVARERDLAARAKREEQIKQARKDRIIRSGGQVAETYSPQTMTGVIYDAAERGLGKLNRLFGVNERDAAQRGSSAVNNLKVLTEGLIGAEELEGAGRRVMSGNGSTGDVALLALSAAPVPKPVRSLAAKAGRGLMRAGERVLGTRAGRYMTEARPLLDRAFSVPATAAPPRSLAARPAMVEPQRGSTAYGTYELAPGVMTRHRQDVLADEALRDRFSLDPATSWRTEQGTDTLYDALGLPQSPTVRMTGVYKPDVPGAVEESNIGFAARPRLRIGPNGEPLPEDYAAMSGAEAVRAVADTQGAGAWSMPILPSDPERAGALFVPTGAPTDIERLLELRERGKKYGLPDIGDLGEGVMLTNFEGMPLGSETQAALRRPISLGQGNLSYDVRQVLGSSARPEAVSTTGDYIGLEKAWMQPEGSGAVSDILRKYLGDMTPQYREAMLEDPRVAQQFGQRFLRDEQARMAGVPVRGDVQRTREAIAEQERLQALFDLIARGRPAMARGGPVSAGE